MSQDFSQHPAIFFGVDPLRDPLLARQIATATFYAGRSVENRLKQTKPMLRPNPEDAPKGQHWSEAPVWTWRQAVGLDDPPEDAEDVESEQALAERAAAQLPEIDAETAELLSGVS